MFHEFERTYSNFRACLSPKLLILNDLGLFWCHLSKQAHVSRERHSTLHFVGFAPFNLQFFRSTSLVVWEGSFRSASPDLGCDPFSLTGPAPLGSRAGTKMPLPRLAVFFHAFLIFAKGIAVDDFSISTLALADPCMSWRDQEYP